MLTAIILRSSRHIEVEVPDAGDEGVPHERRASDDGLRHNVLVRDRESQRDNYLRQRRTRRPRPRAGVASRMRTGTMTVNGGSCFGLTSSLGGYKQSGLGRRNGTHGFE